MEADLKSLIVRKVLSLYDKLSACGKPRDDEYSVLAGVVMECGSEVHVVALASGTKCIGPECSNGEGCLLSDSHGEVLAKRSFVKYLADCITSIIEEPTRSEAIDCPFQWIQSVDGLHDGLKLKGHCKFHMYISDSPCGDASVYASSLVYGDGMNPTGAKLISSNKDSTGSDIYVGSLRTKSGRSDIKLENRTTAMCCSDKVCRWSCLGLQG